ncbi:MAG TPA: hypothetical protein VLQ93_14820 [Myxococcaceae bacterium]|nr:hypothetical protein [Myxococcaceae bacterium]
MLIIRREQMRALAQAREADLSRALVSELRGAHPNETQTLDDESLLALVRGQLAAARQARVPLASRSEFVKKAVLERLAPTPAKSSLDVTSG